MFFPQPNTKVLEEDFKKAEKNLRPYFKGDHNRTEFSPEALINKSRLLSAIHPVAFRSIFV
jgi:hypothetical protein